MCDEEHDDHTEEWPYPGFGAGIAVAAAQLVGWFFAILAVILVASWIMKWLLL